MQISMGEIRIKSSTMKKRAQISTNKYKISTNVKIFKNENKDQKTNKDHKTVFPPSPKIKDRTLFQKK